MRYVKYNPEEPNAELDEYVTPYPLALASIKLLRRFKPDTTAAVRVLEFGCNTGTWGKALKEVYPNAYLEAIDYMDIEKPIWYDKLHRADLRTFETSETFDFGIGNPPYSNRENGVRKTIVDDAVRNLLRFVVINGIVVQLLRANFPYGIRRNQDLFKEYHPVEEHRCLPRPSFFEYDARKGNRKTSNKEDYASYIFIKGVSPRALTSYPFYWREIQ